MASACACASVCEDEAFITSARDIRPRLARARREEVSDLCADFVDLEEEVVDLETTCSASCCSASAVALDSVSAATTAAATALAAISTAISASLAAFCLAACLGRDLGCAEKALALATASVAYSVSAAASLLSTPDCAAVVRAAASIRKELLFSVLLLT